MKRTLTLCIISAGVCLVNKKKPNPEKRGPKPDHVKLDGDW